MLFTSQIICKHFNSVILKSLSAFAVLCKETILPMELHQTGTDRHREREIYLLKLAYTIIGAGYASLKSLEQASRWKTRRQELTLQPTIGISSS